MLSSDVKSPEAQKKVLNAVEYFLSTESPNDYREFIEDLFFAKLLQSAGSLDAEEMDRIATMYQNLKHLILNLKKSIIQLN